MRWIASFLPSDRLEMTNNATLGIGFRLEIDKTLRLAGDRSIRSNNSIKLYEIHKKMEQMNIKLNENCEL